MRLEQDDTTRLRSFPRYTTRRPAHAVQDGYVIPCTLLDISARGARIRFDPIALSSFRGTRCTLRIDGIGSFPAERRWRDRLDMGMELRISDSVASALNNTLQGLAGAALNSNG